MRINKKIIAIFLLTFSATLVYAGEFIGVSKTIKINKGVNEVWKSVGGFCAIKDWHPAVVKCKAYDDHGTLYRTLTLADGATISEKQGDTGTNSYSYFIKKGPLPVKPYHSTFKAEGNEISTTITWKSRFKAKGATDAEAKKIIEGIYETGLSSIAEKLN